MRRAVLLLVVTGLILATAGCGGRSNSTSGSSTQSVNVSSTLKAPVEEYFNQYFDAQKTLHYDEINSSVMAKTESTQLFETFRKTVVEQDQLLNSGIKWYEYKIDYRKCVVKGEEAQLELVLDLDFQYKNVPDDIKSGLYGIKYNITLKNNGTGWSITAIDSDLQEFQAFKTQVQEEITQSGLAQTEAVKKIYNDVRNDLQMISSNSLYLKGASASGIESTDVTAPTANQNTNPTMKSVYVSAKQYTYNPEAAVKYALEYAQKDKNERIFYTISTDCTNFVSQCIWAGYIGYTDEATAITKMNNKLGMVYTEWHAGSGGGAHHWENVNKLWSYLADSTKQLGPMGTTYNNLKRYFECPVSSIKVGDVLQVAKGSGETITSDNYHHSVFVTYKPDNATRYDEVLISSHTTDRKNFKLTDVIAGFGSSNCYMRGFRPQTGYMK